MTTYTVVTNHATRHFTDYREAEAAYDRQVAKAFGTGNTVYLYKTTA